MASTSTRRRPLPEEIQTSEERKRERNKDEDLCKRNTSIVLFTKQQEHVKTNGKVTHEKEQDGNVCVQNWVALL